MEDELREECDLKELLRGGVWTVSHETSKYGKFKAATFCHE
jgi:hypothetical protein